jgi:putative restriction endonuclease
VTTWVGAISSDYQGNWEICKQQSLFGSGSWRARKVRAGDELMVWGSERGWLGRCAATADARPDFDLSEVPWPEPEKYKALIPIEVLAEPPAPIWMPGAELKAIVGLDTWDLRQFPELTPEGEAALRALLDGPTRTSRFERELAAALDLDAVVWPENAPQGRLLGPSAS